MKTSDWAKQAAVLSHDDLISAFLLLFTSFMSYGSVNVDANSFFLSPLSMRRTFMFKGKQQKASEELFTVSVEKKKFLFFLVDKLNTLTISWPFLTYSVTITL